MSRRRWRWDEELKQLVEIGDDWQPTPRFHGGATTEELTYGGMAATDGTLINTRTKHRAYMRQNGYTTVDDYTQYWAKAEKERDGYRNPAAQMPAHERKEIREAISRAAYQLERRGRK